MRLLLDTQVLLWAIVSPRRLRKDVVAELDRVKAYASVASLWEIAIKSSLDKLDVDPDAIFRAVEPTGLTLLPIGAPHAVAVRALPLHHRDPFDRLLIAQAQEEGLTLLTTDGQLAAYGPAVRVIRAA